MPRSPTAPDFSLSFPPRVQAVPTCHDPDRKKHPTVERLVERGSWPVVSLFPPTQAMIDAANLRLSQIWQQMHMMVTATNVPAPAAPAAATDVEARQKAAEDELRQQIRAEVLAEEEVKKAEAAAKKAAEEAEAKAKEEAAKAQEAHDGKTRADAIASYLSAYRSNSVAAGMGTRESYCYHNCGVHARREEPMWDGYPRKEAEKNQSKKDKKAPSTDEAADASADEVSASTKPAKEQQQQQQQQPQQAQNKQKGKNGSPKSNENKPAASNLPSGSVPAPLLASGGLSPDEQMMLDNFRRFKVHAFESAANFDPRGDLPKYGAPFEVDSSDSDDSLGHKYSDPRMRQEYEYHYPTGQPIVRNIEVIYDDEGRAFDRCGKEIRLVSKNCPKPLEKHVRFQEPRREHVFASTESQRPPLADISPRQPKRGPSWGGNCSPPAPRRPKTSSCSDEKWEPRAD